MLLTIAVILPTICLLWFMTQAVKNERLAVRQKLIDTYKQQLEQISQGCDSSYKSLAERFIRDIEQSEKKTGKPPIRLITNLVSIFSGRHSLIVYDANGQVEFPKFEKADIESEVDSEELSEVWNVEFVTKDYETAAKLYGEVAESTQDNIVKCKAIVSKARCLAKKEQYSEAIETCKYLFNAFSTTSIERNVFVLPPAIVINNNIRLIELYIKTSQDYDDLTDGLLTAIGNSHWPLSIREFGLEKLKTFTENGKTIKNESRQAQYHHVHGEIKAERQSISVAEKHPNTSLFGRWKANTIQRIKMPETTYVLFFEDEVRKYVLVNPPDILFGYTNVFKEDSFICKFKDNAGDYFGRHDKQMPAAKPILSAPMGDTFPEWSVELYMKDANIFDDTASKQVAIYTWTGVLVVLLILSSGAIAAQVIGRQIKLNRLKNDFIATVTHELKTPLSSMRVLVDTLLDGNYESEQTTSEYLHLIAKENERLSRLVDNFLTFSRMERNRQAFDIVKTDPAQIAKAAAEAVQTKFNRGNCRFDINIEQSLPDIPADKDAMVTVLVNLLDNAYKYSYDDKKVELKVYAEDSSVCFSVSDNGIGIFRRAMKKIFSRFYQVDRSLTRRAEGTGLGLSIVKFIVDAHKGTIDVVSKPDKGSTFTVKLSKTN